jgi:hypothetical protein
MMLVDPNGLKDTTYNANTDKPVNPQPGTATPIYKYDENGKVVVDEYGNPVLDPNAKNAYNCHSYAWENSQGDPLDPRNADLVAAGITKWDNNPDNNMNGYFQLDSNDPNKKGDKVIYYTDANGNGKYDKGENIEHSAIVNSVDKNGNTTTVIGKMGQNGISINHPRAPGYYTTDGKGNATSRAYFRSTSATNVQSTQSSNSSFKMNYNLQAVRNATYMTSPVIMTRR